ncbi:MAG: hypothetical protein ACKOPK_24920, partial [Dolichospermum sp.]
VVIYKLANIFANRHTINCLFCQPTPDFALQNYIKVFLNLSKKLFIIPEYFPIPDFPYFSNTCK